MFFYFFQRLAEMSLDSESKKDTRHVAKVQKWAGRVVDANDRDGEKCETAVDAGDDLNVFDENDACKLNSQIFSALRSFARTYACNGKGNVARQITRRSRRLEENFERRKSCEKAPETCPWIKDDFLENPDCPGTHPPRCNLKNIEGCLKSTFSQVKLNKKFQI